jgi:hypothetical protein
MQARTVVFGEQRARTRKGEQKIVQRCSSFVLLS